MQEVWKHGNSTIYLICEYVNSGNYEFTAKPDDLFSVEDAKDLTKLSLNLRTIGLSDRKIFRAISKILEEAPGWFLARY